MPTRRDLIGFSLRGTLLTVAAGAGLGACAVTQSSDACRYAGSVHSGGVRTVGGRSIICGSDPVDSAEQVPHVDDHVLRDQTW